MAKDGERLAHYCLFYTLGNNEDFLQSCFSTKYIKNKLSNSVWVKFQLCGIISKVIPRNLLTMRFKNAAFLLY